MSLKLQKNYLMEEEYFKDEHIHLASRKNLVNHENEDKKIMSIFINGIIYTIVYEGIIYNIKELKQKLNDKKINLETNFQIEVILKCFVYFGSEIFKNINGAFCFAIWNNKNEELYLVKDHLGIKPLYYTLKNDAIIFSTEIKAILEYPDIEIKVDNQGLSEIFGLGPVHTPGVTAFKNIYEAKGGNYMIFNRFGIHIQEYWKLESKKHEDNLQITCKKVRDLLEDSIKKQLISDIPISTMLSGGLDSSIITAYASKYCKNKNEILQTYSVDYIDNDKNFVKSDFQPNSDKYYIDIMKNEFNTKHDNIYIDTPELVENLEEAMIAREYPGMADVDSSLLLFCQEISKKNKIALSGECSDEIFAGYPWFFREDALKSNTFPWSIAIEERQKMLSSSISSKVRLKEYIDYRYSESLEKVEIIREDSTQTTEKRKISYLTINWFMKTLIDRAEKMANNYGLEIRIPFCDYRIVEYMWNVPWEMKALNGREKGLLRHITNDLLPEEIVNRKKSPYPKTHNPNYLKAVKEKLYKIIENKNSPINNLINKEYILEILQNDGNNFKRPWFGQLMTGPQVMAYLIQMNMWFEKYNPKIEL